MIRLIQNERIDKFIMIRLIQNKRIDNFIMIRLIQNKRINDLQQRDSVSTESILILNPCFSVTLINESFSSHFTQWSVQIWLTLWLDFSVIFIGPLMVSTVNQHIHDGFLSSDPGCLFHSSLWKFLIHIHGVNKNSSI